MTTPPTVFRSYTQPVNRKDGSRLIGGVCVPYLKPSRHLGAFIEVFETRSFAAGVGMGFPHVVATLEHNMAALLATTDSGTLSISDTPDGPDYELACPNTTAGNDTLELIDSGLISGSSVEMIVRSDHFEYGGTGVPTRRIDEAQLRSVSPVSTPAYPDATTSRRSLDLAIESFARQFDADEDEVRYDLENGNAARYFSDRQPVVIDAKPTPLDVARRSHDGGDLDIRRRQNSLTARKIQMEGGRSSADLDIAERLLELRRRKLAWDNPVETRSYPVGTFGDLDRDGQPARRNSNGHAID